jgi:hypothetical protein
MVTMPTSRGFGWAPADGPETFVVPGLPKGILFWAYKSEDRIPRIIRTFHNGVQQPIHPVHSISSSSSFWREVTGAEDFPGGTFSMTVSGSSGLYYFAWAHSHLDNDPSHWVTQNANWVDTWTGQTV